MREKEILSLGVLEKSAPCQQRCGNFSTINVFWKQESSAASKSPWKEAESAEADWLERRWLREVGMLLIQRREDYADTGSR